MMGDYYPRIKYYSCTIEGELVPLNTMKATPAPSKPVPPRAPLFDNKIQGLEENGECSGTVDVTIWASEGYEVYANGQLMGSSGDSTVRK